MFDVIVIGGSYAGIAAALQLGRARRRVLIIDAGQRRNRFSRHSHGFLGQDGQSGAAIAAKGRAEVLAYPTVSWLDAAATEARATDEGFVVRVDDNEHHAKRLIIATGVVDELPDIPGLTERWGRQIFFCPYCDGYEFQLGRLGVLATRADSAQYAQLVSEWAGPGQTVFFVNDALPPDAEQLAALAARSITIERAPVVAVDGDDSSLTVRLTDGRTVQLDGLFVQPRSHQAGPFAGQLGCDLEMGGHGLIYKTTAKKETTVPGVYACGDAASPVPSVSYAVADGVRAGTAAHQSLVFTPVVSR